MIGLLLALYPARWRRRYGEEFRAVLESRPLGPFDVADVILGAMDARLAFRFPETSSALGGHFTMLRLGAYGAIAGGILWASGLVVSSATVGDTTWLPVILLGTVALLFAFVGLSAFQAQQAPLLAWTAFAIPAFGALASLIGLVGMLFAGGRPLLGGAGAWDIWVIGLLAMVVGSVLFAIATIRAAVLSRNAAIALAISAVVLLVVSIAGLGFMSPDAARLLFVVPVVGFAGSWIWLGISALRSGPIRAVAPA